MHSARKPSKIQAVVFCGAAFWFVAIVLGKPEPGKSPNGVPQANSELARTITSLKQAADDGDAAAQTKLAILYGKGIAGAKGKTRSVELYQKAANGGFAAAPFCLAGLYERGDGVPRDVNKAISLYEQAADRGYAPAQFYLGFLYQTGTGVLQNPTKAAELYQKAANQEYSAAQFFLGVLYEKGTGVPKNIEKAIELEQAASGKGQHAATVHLASLYETGSGVSKDLNKAMELYRKAADQGSKLAAQQLKRLQPKTTPSPAAQIAASVAPHVRPEPDDCERKYEEAIAYNSGMNRFAIDGDEMIKRLKALAREGCAEATARLAQAGEEGNWADVPHDEKSAQKLADIAVAEGLIQRANDGRPAAKYLLGFLHQYGLGVADDSDKAWEFRADAAKAGYAHAQWWIAGMSEKYKHPTDAAYWYGKAAEQGDAWSQLALGLMYDKGVGVEKDPQKAMQLIRQAANQGLPDARAQLKKMQSKPVAEATPASTAESTAASATTAPSPTISQLKQKPETKSATPLTSARAGRFAGSWKGVTQTFPWGAISQTFTIDPSETSVTMLSDGGPDSGNPATAKAVRSGDSLQADFGLRGSYTFTVAGDSMHVRLQALLNDNTATYRRIGGPRKSR